MPYRNRFAVEIPTIEKRRAGLDADLLLWLILDEFNSDIIGRSFYLEPEPPLGHFSKAFFAAESLLRKSVDRDSGEWTPSFASRSIFGWFLLKDGVDCPITPMAFLPEKIKEEIDRVLFLFELMSFHLTVRPNPSPPPRQACLPKQVRLDRHRVEAGHVLIGILTFDIKVIGLGDHAPRIA